VTFRQSKTFEILPKTRPTCEGKGRGAIRISRRDEDPARAGEAVADMGTRCRSGRRPGGTDLAIIGQGLQAYLSLPRCC